MNVEQIKKETFVSAFNRLQEVIQEETTDTRMVEYLRDAVIQRYEFTLELAWKYLRYVLLNEGLTHEEVASPKKTIKSAFANGLITQGETWLEMLKTRNSTSHMYSHALAISLEEKIRNEYFIELQLLSQS